MRSTNYMFIGEGSEQFNDEEVSFLNLHLESENLKIDLGPIVDMIGQRIFATYKNNCEISCSEWRINKSNLVDFMQFDDICIKLLHVKSGLDAYMILGARLARTLLIQLLKSSMIDDSSGTLFSSTEKGIFSFIIARLFLELKSCLREEMPDMKITGIFHAMDETVKAANTVGLGVYDFSFSFASDVYPVSLLMPISIIRKAKQAETHQGRMLARCGHIIKPLAFYLKTLSISDSDFDNMSPGDLIIFDSSEMALRDGALQGSIFGRWGEISLMGELVSHDSIYTIRLNGDSFSQQEMCFMEEIEVRGASGPNDSESSSRISMLAESIRVPLSIEISRLPMSLKELSLMKDGQIIDLHRKIDDPLEMVVEGKVIGYCHPVQIDGRLGIRILTILGDDENAEDELA